MAKYEKTKIEAIRQLYLTAADKGLALVSDDLPKPSTELAHKAIVGCLNKRNGQWRRTKPIVSSEESILLWQLVKFHRGNGSLWGYPHFAKVELREKLDTLAIVLLGGQSSASDNWARALGK